MSCVLHPGPIESACTYLSCLSIRQGVKYIRFVGGRVLVLAKTTLECLGLLHTRDVELSIVALPKSVE